MYLYSNYLYNGIVKLILEATMKRYKICICLVAIILLFVLFLTEGFGLFNKTAYGNTIGQALNYWHDKGLSTIGYTSTISTIDINKNEKLVIYISTNHTLCSGLLKKDLFGRWTVINMAGELSLDYKDTPDWKNTRTIPAINWQWSNMKSFGFTFGVIYNPNVDYIKIGSDYGKILRTSLGDFWYYIDKTSNYQNSKTHNYNTMAYDNNKKLLYSDY
jgi:hypothetical protein